MRRLLSLLFIVLGLSATAQNISPAMQKAVEICKNLSNSIDTVSTASLKAANIKLKAAGIRDFSDIWLVKGKDLDVDGHFIFDEEFVDSLINNRLIIKFAARYLKKRTLRGSFGTQGGIKMTTKALKAGEKAVWKTLNRNVAEYALVAEPGGTFTMTIRDAKGRALYSETAKNKQGASVRMARLQLPAKRMELFIEIINTGRSDASFALLGN